MNPQIPLIQKQPFCLRNLCNLWMRFVVPRGANLRFPRDHEGRRQSGRESRAIEF